MSLLFGSLAVPLHYERVLALRRADMLGYWRLYDTDTGSTHMIDSSGRGHHGASSNVTLLQPGLGDGYTAAGFNGTTSYGNVHSAGLAAGFNGAEGTATAWLKVSGSGIWADGVARRALWLNVDAGNRAFFGKSSTNDSIGFGYNAGSVNYGIPVAVTPTLDWLHIAMSWSKSADELRLYVNGVQAVATQTGLGTFAGSIGTSLIGAQTTTPTAVWNGSLAHVAIWSVALTPGEVAHLSSRY